MIEFQVPFDNRHAIYRTENVFKIYAKIFRSRSNFVLALLYLLEQCYQCH